MARSISGRLGTVRPQGAPTSTSDVLVPLAYVNEALRRRQPAGSLVLLYLVRVSLNGPCDRYVKLVYNL